MYTHCIKPIQISRELSLVDSVKSNISSLLNELQAASSETSGLGLWLRNVSDAISNVITECNELLDLGVRDLEELCNNLATNQGLYVPRLSMGVVNLVGGASPLVQLQELVSNPLFDKKENFSEFTDFLAELVGRAIA